MNMRNNLEPYQNLKYIEALIARYQTDEKINKIKKANEYYFFKHEILNRSRFAKTEHGKYEEITALPNNRLVDNVYRILVDQKANFMVGRPIKFTTKNKDYQEHLKKLLGADFMVVINEVAINAINHGEAWLHPFVDEDGNLKYYCFTSDEIIPVWDDEKLQKLNFAIRTYTKEEYDFLKNKFEERKYIEIYSKNGKQKYLVDKKGYHLQKNESYMVNEGEETNWTKTPLIHFKYHSDKVSLLDHVLSLQDAINKIDSTFMNVYEEDPRSSLMIVVNYDGENKEDFRANLAQFGTVFVSNDGDVRTLNIEIDHENYLAIRGVIEKRIYANGKGYDISKLDRMGNAPNELHIKTMYVDINNQTDTSILFFTNSLEKLLEFVNQYIEIKENKNYSDELVKIGFERNMLTNETEIIDNILKSGSVMSRHTQRVLHPRISDPDIEEELIKEEQKQQIAILEPYQSYQSDISDNEA